MQGKGIGTAILGELIRRCEALDYRQMIAVIGDSANAASIKLHAAAGFVRAGTLRSMGFKFGRWVDSVLMQRPLGRGTVQTVRTTFPFISRRHQLQRVGRLSSGKVCDTWGELALRNQVAELRMLRRTASARGARTRPRTRRRSTRPSAAAG